GVGDIEPVESCDPCGIEDLRQALAPERVSEGVQTSIHRGPPVRQPLGLVERRRAGESKTLPDQPQEKAIAWHIRSALTGCSGHSSILKLDRPGTGVLRHACQLTSGNITKGQGRSQVDTSGRVETTHDGCPVITRGVETLDRCLVLPQHTGATICGDSGEGTEAAGEHLDRVEETFFNRSKRRVGGGFLVPSITVEGGFPAVELRVDALLGVVVEVTDGLGESRGINAALLREFLDGVTLDQVSTAQVGGEGNRQWFRHTQWVFA